jgi:Tfp pilus assembly protein PilP
MMIMKKIFVMISLAALALAGCTKGYDDTALDEKIKDLEAYKAFVKSRKDGTFHATPEEQPTVTVTKRRGRKPATANDAADEAPEQESQSEEA